MQRLIDGKVLALAALVLVVTLGALYFADLDVEPHRPATPEEQRAVLVARSYLAGSPYVRVAPDQEGWIVERRGQLDVYFPHPRAETPVCGPAATVDPRSHGAAWKAPSDCVIDPDR